MYCNQMEYNVMPVMQCNLLHGIVMYCNVEYGNVSYCNVMQCSVRYCIWFCTSM